MKAEDDTQEILVSERRRSQDGSQMPDLGPWGKDAVPLGGAARKRRPAKSTRHAATKPHQRVAVAAITCVTGLLAAFGANILSGESAPQTEKPQVGQVKRQPAADKPAANGARAARRRRQARSKSRQRAIHSARPTHPAPSPTYAPAPKPVPTPEPVTPSPAPAPASGPTQTAKPPPASGPAVAKEFGFER